MRMLDGRTGLDMLTPEECSALLAADHVGRLAVVDGFSPVVFPVNYALDGRDIVVRVSEGSKLDAVGRANACFQLDGFDREGRSGWSVMVVGRLEEVTPYDRDYARVAALPLEPWAEGDRSHLLRLVPSRVTGRSIGGAR